MKEPRLALKITVKCEDEGYWSSYADPMYPIIIEDGYLFFTDTEEGEQEMHKIIDDRTFMIEIVKITTKEESL